MMLKCFVKELLATYIAILIRRFEPYGDFANRAYQTAILVGPVAVAPLIAGLIALTIVIGGNVLLPLLVSFALAFMLEPLADWFQRRGRSRSVAVLLTLGSAVLMGTLLLLFLLPGIYHQLMESIEKLPLALRAVAENLPGQ